MAHGDMLPTGFPGTVQDLPRENRIEVNAEGYLPFEDAVIYQALEIADEKEIPVEVQQALSNTNQIGNTNSAPLANNTTPMPSTMPTSNLVPFNPAPMPSSTGYRAAPVSYTPGKKSTTSDSQQCTKHTNNDATIIRTISGCNKLSGIHQTRCTKCVNHAGTYENGRCFIEILHWFCQGTGWDGQDPRSCPDNYKYQGCGMIRKYVDAEQPFYCPLEGALSGCCQHGGSLGSKHPPFNIDGASFYEMNCKMPLSSNLDWRVVRSNGLSIWVSGVNYATRNWCMPNSKAGPWNSHNHQGKYTHCGATISGGTTIQQWHKIN